MYQWHFSLSNDSIWTIQLMFLKNLRLFRMKFFLYAFLKNITIKITWIIIFRCSCIWYIHLHISDDVPVLSHQSLLILAGALPSEYATTLGVALRVPYEDILDIKALDQPSVITNFEILWKWRGKVASQEMVDALVNGLREIKQKRLIDVIMRANAEKRHIKHSDVSGRHSSVHFAVDPSWN